MELTLSIYILFENINKFYYEDYNSHAVRQSFYKLQRIWWILLVSQYLA